MGRTRSGKLALTGYSNLSVRSRGNAPFQRSYQSISYLASAPSKQKTARNAQPVAKKLWRQGFLFLSHASRLPRKRLLSSTQAYCNKTSNPRLFRIHFHTFRHRKATLEYHKTKDILHIMKLLGHKNIKNTLVYTQLVDFNEQDYTSKDAWTLEEACKLIEAGFQYICDFENAKLFRKPK